MDSGLEQVLPDAMVDEMVGSCGPDNQYELCGEMGLPGHLDGSRSKGLGGARRQQTWWLRIASLSVGAVVLFVGVGTLGAGRRCWQRTAVWLAMHAEQ